MKTVGFLKKSTKTWQAGFEMGFFCWGKKTCILFDGENILFLQWGGLNMQMQFFFFLHFFAFWAILHIFLLCGCIFLYLFCLFFQGAFPPWMLHFFAFFGFSPAEILAFNALKRKPVTGAEGAEENFWTILNGPFLSWTPCFPCKLHFFDFLHFFAFAFSDLPICIFSPPPPLHLDRGNRTFLTHQE